MTTNAKIPSLSNVFEYYALPERFCGPGFRLLTLEDWGKLCDHLDKTEFTKAHVSSLQLDLLHRVQKLPTLQRLGNPELLATDAYWGTSDSGSFGIWGPVNVHGAPQRAIVAHAGLTGHLAIAVVNYEPLNSIVRSGTYIEPTRTGGTSCPDNCAYSLRNQLYYGVLDGLVRIPNYVWERYFPGSAPAKSPDSASAEPDRALQFFGAKAPLTSKERDGFYDRYDD